MEERWTRKAQQQRQQQQPEEQSRGEVSTLRFEGGKKKFLGQIWKKSGGYT